MSQFTFKEIIDFFGDKLKTSAPQEDVEKKEVEIVIDQLHAILSQGNFEGSMRMEITMGLILQPVPEEKLKELATSNFLGINTGGCTLAFDKTGTALSLLCHTTTGHFPQDQWEWLHRLLAVAREWHKQLAPWPQFVPLNAPKKEIKNDSPRKGTKA